MDRVILGIIGDFQTWRGDTYRLASLIVEAQKDLDRQKLIDHGYPEAAELID